MSGELYRSERHNPHKTAVCKNCGNMNALIIWGNINCDTCPGPHEHRSGLQGIAKVIDDAVWKRANIALYRTTAHQRNLDDENHFSLEDRGPFWDAVRGIWDQQEQNRAEFTAFQVRDTARRATL